MRSTRPGKVRSASPSICTLAGMPGLIWAMSPSEACACTSRSERSTSWMSGASKPTFSPGCTWRFATTPALQAHDVRGGELERRLGGVALGLFLGVPALHGNGTRRDDCHRRERCPRDPPACRRSHLARDYPRSTGVSPSACDEARKARD